MIYREIRVGTRDLLAMLLAGRWVFVFTFLVVFVTVSALVLMLPATYESRAVIKLAKHSAYFDDPDSIAARLIIKHKALVTARARKHATIVLKTRADSAVRARDLLAQIVDDLVQEQHLASERLIEFHKANIAEFTVQIEEYEQRIDRLNNLVENSDRVSQLTVDLWHEAGVALLKQRFILLQKRLAFEEDRFKLAKLPRILTRPAVPVSPVWPQPKRHLTMGAVLAVLLGTIAAFLVGYVKYLRQQA